MVRDVADALLTILLAPLCGACDRPLSHPTHGCVCDDCWQGITVTPPPHCSRCGDSLLAAQTGQAVSCACADAASVIAQARAIGPHEGALRAIVHALKYDGRRSIAPRLSGMMRACATDLLAGADVAVPVPLHHARQRQRGFNQADDLARHLGLPVFRALRRIRHTEVQAELHAAERQSNVAGAFATTTHTSALRGTVVVLVDDVRTTGATLEACARVLKAAGVREVRVVTAARVAPRSR